MSPAVATIAGTIIVALIGVIGVLIQFGKKSPASWDALSGRQAEENKRVSDRLEKVESEVSRLRDVEVVLHRVLRFWVPDLIAWGRDGGQGEPPAPPAGVDSAMPPPPPV